MEPWPRPRPTPGPRFFKDFQPSFEWVRDGSSENLLIKLPGFKKEQIKVQVDSYRSLRISGERPLDGNQWSRFRKDFRIGENFSINEIKAKFEDGVLYVILPKPITRAEPQGQSERAHEPPATQMKPGGAQLETTQKAGTEASAEPEAAAGKQVNGKRSNPAEAKKDAWATQVKEKDRPEGTAAAGEVAGDQKSADAGKKEPPAADKGKAAAAGVAAGGQKSVPDERQEPPAVAEKERAAAAGEVAAGGQKSVHDGKKEQPAAAEKEKAAATGELAGGMRSVVPGKKEPPASEKEKAEAAGDVAGAQKPVLDGKKEPLVEEKKTAAGGEKGGESVHAGKIGTPAGDGGGGGAVGGTGAAREGGGLGLRLRLRLGLSKPNQLLVNVAVAVMLLLGIAVYLTYKVRKTV